MLKSAKKYSIWALGCQMNKSDAERLERVLIDWGYIKSAEEETADLVVVVACSVKQHAMDRINGKFRLWQKRRDKGELFTILSGCVVEKDRNKLAKQFDLIIPISNINQIPEHLSKLHPVDVHEYFHIKPVHESSFQAYVPIMTGCNNFCSYCVVPYTRGREVSRAAQEVIDECRELIVRGYKEITLLGQNVNSYRSISPPFQGGAGGGLPMDYDFPRLLREIDEIGGDFWLRFLSSHPKDFSDDLIEVMAKGEHTTPYLHLAIQSGDKAILEAMNRKYTPEHYLGIISRARKAMPNVMISTDIIVGFPGETEEQFLNTAKLMKEVEFDMAYISEYSRRTGTEAGKMDDNVSKAEKRRRRDVLTDILARTLAKHNQELVGQKVRVLVEKSSPFQGEVPEGRRGLPKATANHPNPSLEKEGIKKYYGKTDTFRNVVFVGDGDLVGKFVDVTIEKVDRWGLSGNLSVLI